MIEWEARRGLSDRTAAAELSGMEQLVDLTPHLISCKDSASAFELVLDSAMALQGADFGLLQTYTPERGVLEIARHRGFDATFLKSFEYVSADDSCACGRALRGKNPIVIADVEDDPELSPYLASIREAGFRSIQSFPMICTADRFVGVLSTCFRKPGLPSAARMHVMTLYARQAAEVIAHLQAEEAGMGVQKLAAWELNHRLKNVIAMIQALARLSLKGASDLSNFSGDFQARLVTLGRAHDALAKGNWRDVDLQAMLREQILTLGGDRISLSGPEVRISADTAYLCALALHELTANALKHGALSAAAGRVSIDWRVDAARRTLHLRWVERGGPVVKPPETVGFGSALMSILSRSRLFEIDSSFEPRGLVCDLRLPMDLEFETVSAQSEPAV